MFGVDDVVGTLTDAAAGIIEAAGETVEALTGGLVNPVDVAVDLLDGPLSDAVSLGLGVALGGPFGGAAELADELLEAIRGG